MVATVTVRNIALHFVTMDKFDKKEHCEYCGSKMKAKQRNKRFCSDKCRVYWHRENDKSSELVKDVAEQIMQGTPTNTYQQERLKQKLGLKQKTINHETNT